MFASVFGGDLNMIYFVESMAGMVLTQSMTDVLFSLLLHLVYFYVVVSTMIIIASLHDVEYLTLI